jgi:ribonuclease Z
VHEGVVFDDGTVRVLAAPTDHAPVRPTVGFRVEAEGKAVVIAGDTVPCDGLDRLCAGADAYVQTTIRRSLVEPIPLPRLQDILDYHSTIEDAAATATRGGVRTLVLTHLVPAPAPGTEGEWEAEARAGFVGDVVVGADLTTVEV